MTKRQLIDEILTMNRSARPSFLAEFEDHDLSEYLDHLLAVCGPKPQGDPWWPERHLKNRPATPPADAAKTPPPSASAPPSRTTPKTTRCATMTPTTRSTTP